MRRPGLIGHEDRLGIAESAFPNFTILRISNDVGIFLHFHSDGFRPQTKDIADIVGDEFNVFVLHRRIEGIERTRS
jgi:hypothetical protein